MRDLPHPADRSPAFRLDVPLHNVLVRRDDRPEPLRRTDPLALPDPPFPRYPKLLDERVHARYATPPERRVWTPAGIYRTMRGWLFPYVKSRVLPGDFHPIVAYLFTEYKCNLDCHYCWAYDNSVKGMTEDVARRSIDWLHASGCRVLALMGGEPLLRPKFVHKVIDYAARKGFWVYLPTNGRLLTPKVVDWIGDAGVATVNFAVDAVDEKPGLPKALNRARSNFEYLVQRQYEYGYIVFLNINICRNNMDDVRELTEIARKYRLITDYHINESPMLEQPHYKHLDNNETFIRQEDWPALDALLDWLIEKNRAGYKMVNSVQRLSEMKQFARGALESWGCRAGHNNVIIRVDGTLAPCFPMYSATYDWGVVGAHKFDTAQLTEMKRSCETHCFSTLNHNLAFSYDARRATKWLLRQAKRGFQGVSGSFD